VLRAHARAIADLDGADFDRLVHVLAWLRENRNRAAWCGTADPRHPHKWIESRRGLVEALHRAGTGAPGLGLREPSPLIRIRALDASLSFQGLTDLSAPVDDLAASTIRPERVFVFENLATLLAMPDVPRAVAVHGGGHRVDLVARLPWAQTVTYWGDLDSHGFAIPEPTSSQGSERNVGIDGYGYLFDHRDLGDRSGSERRRVRAAHA
jgi:hypothetical protein